ncbi:MAG: PKD domain-containing protein [SAR202 cluster bacterium]|nr:PKD domain-containing protein [SAR202 cluster bacterium]MDP6713036.1 PKD domain-containing protein [SAR202 cluster bacterium]
MKTEGNRRTAAEHVPGGRTLILALVALAFVILQATDYSVVLAADPIANPGGPYTGNEGSAITFTGSAVDIDEPSSNLRFEWDFDFQSTFAADASGVGVATTTHTYADNDTFTVALRVIDSTGATSTVKTAQVTVANVPPSANAGGPYTVNEGTALTFTGSATDPGNDTKTFEWDFDYDGSTFTVDSTGADLTGPTKTYTNDGAKTVGLRVRDDDGGLSSIALATTTINNVPPTASIGSSFTGTEGSEVLFSGSATDPGNDTLTYEWDFAFVTGETFTADQSGDGLTAPKFTYTNDGDFTAAMRVRDDDSTSSQVTAPVAISNVVPTASVGGPYTGFSGTPLTFSGSATDPGADTLTYEWDFQYNGSTFSTVGATTNSGVDLTAPKYTYATVGTFTVALRVKDDKGVSSIVTSQVTVGGTTVPSANQWGLIIGGLALAALVMWRARRPVMATQRN